jgi:hypothetical protein
MHTIPQVLELKERADAIFNLGRYEQAIGLYHEAIRLSNSHVECTVDQGVLLSLDSVLHRGSCLKPLCEHL